MDIPPSLQIVFKRGKPCFDNCAQILDILLAEEMEKANQQHLNEIQSPHESICTAHKQSGRDQSYFTCSEWDPCLRMVRRSNKEEKQGTRIVLLLFTPDFENNLTVKTSTKVKETELV